MVLGITRECPNRARFQWKPCQRLRSSEYSVVGYICRYGSGIPAYLKCHLSVFYRFGLNSTTITSATVLEEMLDTVDVFLIPEQEYASNSYFENLGASWAEVLTAFAERGGVIILCGNPSAYNIIDGSGLMHMEYFMPVYSEVLTVEDSMHYLTEGISGAVLSQDGTFLMSLADSAASNIVSYYDHSVVAHKNVGRGDVVYIGYDFFNYDDNAARMIANAVASANRSSWLSLGVAMDTIAGGTSGSPIDF